jgi:drug/metabolite transporter (DMT)-like permease
MLIPLPAISAPAALGLSLALLSMLTYGACMVAVSIVMRGMSSGPGSMLAAAAGIPAGLLLTVAQLIWLGPVEPPSLWAVGAFALAGICSTYLGRWLVFKSIELIGPSGASGLQSTSPLITAVLGWLFLGETVGAVGLVGMALGIVGLGAMSVGIGQSQQQQQPAGSRGSWRQRGAVLGTLVFGLASAAAYSGSHVFRAAGVRDWNQPLIGATIGAVAGLLVLALASRKRLPEYIREIRANPAAARVYAGVGVLQFIAQALVIAAMKYIPASVAALISMCTPLVVMPVSFFVLRKIEKLSWATVLGICITLAGIALVVLYGPART